LAADAEGEVKSVGPMLIIIHDLGIISGLGTILTGVLVLLSGEIQLTRSRQLRGRAARLFAFIAIVVGGLVIGFALVMPTPWPNQPCPNPGCGRQIRDLLAEMTLDESRALPGFKELLLHKPGAAITCPFCQGPVEFQDDGNLALSTKVPLRYSRTKVEKRAKDYGGSLNPPKPNMAPEEWIAEEKLMPGALQGYIYAEDQP